MDEDILKIEKLEPGTCTRCGYKKKLTPHNRFCKKCVDQMKVILKHDKSKWEWIR